ALLPPRILSLANDSSVRVRFQAALTIGEFENPKSQAALLGILQRDYRFRWSRLAVFSSLRAGAAELFRLLLADADFRQTIDESKTASVRELADLIGARAEN